MFSNMATTIYTFKNLLVEHLVNGLVSEEDVTRINNATRTLKWVNHLVCEAISLFGTVTNIINIICFVHQGFKDPINVSLLGLAVSDLGCLVTLLFSNICVLPGFQEVDLPFDAMEVQYIVTGWPHIIFTRVSSWITALIILERCLCITMPLKVKSMVTTKRVTIILVGVYTILICSVSPVFYVNRLAWKFYPEKNKTILGMVFTDDRAFVEEVTFTINNVIMPAVAFGMIIICTVTLVIKLRSKAQWRMKCATTPNVDSVSERDQKVARMVVMISALFIACFVPASFIFIAILVEPSLSLGGRYESVTIIAYGIGIILESVNSSLNIFIYYHMSTRYRNAFRRLFHSKVKVLVM